jgi:hypothetical protein
MVSWYPSKPIEGLGAYLWTLEGPGDEPPTERAQAYKVTARVFLPEASL